MTQQHTPTLEPLTPGLYYLDTIECAKINAHDDLAAALLTLIRDLECCGKDAEMYKTAIAIGRKALEHGADAIHPNKG